MSESPVRQAVVVCTTLLLIGLLIAFWVPAEAIWVRAAQKLMVFPVLAAALWFGWRGGALTASAAAAALVYAERSRPVGIPPGELAIEGSVLLAAGIAVGVYAMRARRRAAEHEALLAELRQAHTDLQENFDGMKRAERLFALGQLSAGLAHEIRNPLASLSGAAGILRRNPDATPKQTELLGIIEKECQRLNRLLTNFLDFARPRPAQPRPVSIDAIFDAVIGLAQHAVGKKQISLRKEVAHPLPRMECDAEQIQQVLLNMVINSIHASSDGDTVVLRARDGDGRVWLEVRDEGCGVKPEHVDRLFDPFFTTKEHGTGLGLPVAHEIVRSLGGELKVRHNENRGMTFSVGIPVGVVQAAGDAPAAEREADA